MIKILQSIHPFFIILVATILEVSGDAIVRNCIYKHTGAARIGFALVGAVLLFGYGFFVNLTAVEFGKIAGLYIATLFVVWQVINYISFGSIPSMPVIVGGLMIVAGGLIVTFWKA